MTVRELVSRLQADIAEGRGEDVVLVDAQIGIDDVLFVDESDEGPPMVAIMTAREGTEGGKP